MYRANASPSLLPSYTAERTPEPDERARQLNRLYEKLGPRNIFLGMYKERLFPVRARLKALHPQTGGWANPQAAVVVEDWYYLGNSLPGRHKRCRVSLPAELELTGEPDSDNRLLVYRREREGAYRALELVPRGEEPQLRYADRKSYPQVLSTDCLTMDCSFKVVAFPLDPEQVTLDPIALPMSS